jgi:Rod binding domain-containing protein
MRIAATLPAQQNTTDATPEQTAKLKHVATDFEALLIGQMLRSARESSSANSDDDSDQSNESLIELGEQQFAKAIAGSGGLGIANMIVAGLSKNAH